MAKRPAFQFYPADWLSDTALRMCSEGARGVWMDMICYMHEGSPYGYLKVNGKVIGIDSLSRMIGCDKKRLAAFVGELVSAGVVQQDAEQAYFSKRMIRDEQIREARAAGGIKGGNPELMGKKDNLKDNLPSDTEDKQKPTPSSSSSSSSSKDLTALTESGDSIPRIPPCPTQEIVNLFHLHAPSLVQPRIVTDAVKAQVAARWKQSPIHQNLKFWEDLFAYAESSHLLAGRTSGRNGGKPWKASLEWVVKADNFAKIINGNYDNA